MVVQHAQQHRRNVLVIVAVVFMAIMVGVTAIFFLRTPQARAAITYPPSVLKLPNVGTSIVSQDAYSMQDVTLSTIGGIVQVNDNNTASNRWAPKTQLEIAKLNIHHMKAVTFGVYVTSDVLDPAKNPTNSTTYLNLQFLRGTGCTLTDGANNAFNVSPIAIVDITGTGGTTTVKKWAAGGSGDYTQSVSGATDLGPTLQHICYDFATHGSLNTISQYTQSRYALDLWKYKGQFVDDAETGLKKLVVSFYYPGGRGISTDAWDARASLGSVRFSLQLTNACGGVSACREYLATTQASSDNIDPARYDNRNYALSGPTTANGGAPGNSSTLPNYLIRRYFEFGLPCTVNAAKVDAKVNIYDLNDGGWVGNKSIVSAIIQKYDTTASPNQWVDVIPKAGYQYINSSQPNQPIIPVVTGTDNTAANTGTVNAQNALMYKPIYNNSHYPINVTIPMSGSGLTTQLVLDMQPGVRYRLVLTPDSITNFIAVGLPADTIFGIIQCTPPANFNLDPVTTVSKTTVVPGDSLPTFSYNVNKTSGGAGGPINWSIYQFVIPANLSYDVSVKNTGTITPCGYYTTKYPGITCAVLASAPATGSVSFASGDTTKSVRPNETVASLPPNLGDRICRALVISQFTGNPSDGAKDSGIVCFTYAASPYSTIVGGNLWAGGSATTPFGGVGIIRGTGNASFGSFGEYGVFATGSINGFGSSGHVPGSSASSGSNASDPLTFATNAAGSPLGSFTPIHQITDFSGLCSTSAPMTISSALTLGLNQHQLVCAPNDTVTINADIRYNTAGALTFGALPSMVIIAKDIRISGNVQQIDGMLYATNSLVACYEGPQNTGENGDPVKAANISSQGTAICNKLLTINGAVTVTNSAVGSLVLNRSYGGTAAGQAAEVFRMRPEVFLTPYENVTSPTSYILRTVKETELPPRY